MFVSRRIGRYVGAGLGLLVLAAAALANVDLSLQPGSQDVPQHGVAMIRLVATADGSATEWVGAVEAILSWDPAQLELLGLAEGQAGYTWMLAGFPNNPDGLNAGVVVPFQDIPTNDGDAIFAAFAQPGNPAGVPPGPGLVVTAFRFRVLAATGTTTVSLLAEYGSNSHTRVLAANPPNLDITGDISGAASVVVVPPHPGDLDYDGDVDLADYALFADCMTGPYRLVMRGECGAAEFTQADLDADGDVDLADFAAFQGLLGTP